MATKLLTVAEAAERLRVSPETLRDWMSQRRVAVVKFGPGRSATVRIEEAEIERLIEAGRRPAWGHKRKVGT